ncbi:MAG: phosphoribosyltransferase family protein, partial [Spirochaetota bacterium]|nr:phosphoribosyltransferase family protein [Spirochaetota bacterium]
LSMALEEKIHKEKVWDKAKNKVRNVTDYDDNKEIVNELSLISGSDLTGIDKLLKDESLEIVVVDMPIPPDNKVFRKIMSLVEISETKDRTLVLLCSPEEKHALVKFQGFTVKELSRKRMRMPGTVICPLIESLTEKFVALLELVRKEAGKAVLYVCQRESGEMIEEFLRNFGESALYVRKNDTENKKRFIRERFQDEIHLFSVRILICHEAKDINTLKTNVSWVAHFEYADNLEIYLTDLAWTGSDTKNMRCWLFNTPEDRALRENRIVQACPDGKSLRMVYGYVKGSFGNGAYRFVSLKELYDTMRLPEAKVKSTLAFLEAEKYIRKRETVISVCQCLIDKEYINVNPYYMAILKDKLITLLAQGMVELLKYCADEKILPQALTRCLLELHSAGKLEFIKKECRDVFVLNNFNEGLKKYSHGELRKKVSADKELHRFLELSKWVLQQPSSCISENKVGIPTDSLGLRSIVRYHVLKLLMDAPMAMGKYLISQVLTGSQSAKIMKHRLNEEFMYNSLSLMRPEAIQKEVSRLVTEGILDVIYVNDSSMRALRVSPAGMSWLKDKQIAKNIWKSHQNCFSNQSGSLYPLLKEAFLREYDLSVNDTVLRAISLYKPRSTEELSMLKYLKPEQTFRVASVVLPFTRGDNYQEPQTDLGDLTQNVKEFLEEYFPPLYGQFDMGYSLSLYSLPTEGRKRYSAIGRLVHNYKYKGKGGLTKTLTDRVLTLFSLIEEFRKADLVCHVPVSGKYPSIAVLLCEWISRAYEIAYYPGLIRKKRESKDQKTMSTVTEKMDNVKNLFDSNRHDLLKDKTVLLVDDIHDSGATLNACSTTLKEAGAGMVFVLTCAKTCYRGT